MAGELDDPLLLSSVPGGTSLIAGTERSGKTSFGIGKPDDDSSMGMNMTGAPGNEDSALSIGKLGAASGMGVDDSELSNTGVGVPQAKNKSKSGGDSKNKKKPKDKKRKKSKKHDSDDDMDNNEPSTMKITT